jgi:DNA-binding NtrC family response regulator
MQWYALIIDADAEARETVRQWLIKDNWQVAEAASAGEAALLISKRPWELVFCDAGLSVRLVDEDQGLTLLGELKRGCSVTARVIITAEQGRPITALEFLLNGASDYMRKPCGEVEVRAHSQAVLERSEAVRRESANVQYTAVLDEEENSAVPHAIVGASGSMLNVLRELARSLRGQHTDIVPSAGGRAPTYLITGETGTGKELVARLIHNHSRYRNGSFVPINCSNVPAELADAELFGSNPGAFTGASRDEQPGLWELASGGTLFLDEITEAPLSLQPKLLRVLQDGQIKRLGAKYLIKTDVQVVAASNRDVETEIKTGRFRADLYHRLNLHHIHLPPLRQRQEDVPLLAAHFAKIHSADRVRLSHDAVKLLVKFSNEYPWYGNIRELENVMRRAVMQAPDATVYAVDLRPQLPPRYDKEFHAEGGLPGEEFGRDTRTQVPVSTEGEGLEERVRRFRSDVVKDTLAAHHGNRSRAANALGVSRPKLHRLLRELEKHDSGRHRV